MSQRRANDRRSLGGGLFAAARHLMVDKIRRGRIVSIEVLGTKFSVRRANDEVRVVVTGIGFLGAGLILHRGQPAKVAGLTTAAAVWLTAGIGVAAGAGQLAIAWLSLLERVLTRWLGQRRAANGAHRNNDAESDHSE